MPETMDERFDRHTLRSDGCWLWASAVRGDGYGAFEVVSRTTAPSWLPLSKQVSAHRYAYARAVGSWPTGQVLHTCDTPLCVRPEHLYEGTNVDNMRDKVERGRAPALEEHGMARLTADDVRQLRAGVVKDGEIAALRGVTIGAARHARVGITWKSLDNSQFNIHREEAT
jgi:hypothetical protein